MKTLDDYFKSDRLQDGFWKLRSVFGIIKTRRYLDINGIRSR